MKVEMHVKHHPSVLLEHLKKSVTQFAQPLTEDLVVTVKVDTITEDIMHIFGDDGMDPVWIKSDEYKLLQKEIIGYNLENFNTLEIRYEEGLIGRANGKLKGYYTGTFKFKI